MILKGLAKAAGISPVYQSYIENSKRPAPSEKVLKRYAEILGLSEDDTGMMYILAGASRKTPRVPVELADYINKNKVISDTLHLSKKVKASADDWTDFYNRIRSKYL